MKDMQRLPKGRSQTPPVSLIDEIPSAKDKPSSAPSWRARLMPLRLCLWSLLFLAIGLLIGYALLPSSLPTDGISRLLAAHLPEKNTSFHLVFLRLCVSCLPAGLLLSASGLTGFSKTIISLVFCWRGLADGMAIAMLCLWTSGRLTLDQGCSFPWLPAALGGWVLVRLISRWLLAVSARRTATEYYRISGDQAHAVRARPLVIRHLTVTLWCFLMVTLACLGYAYILILIV